jgi:hypothetical protein
MQLPLAKKTSSMTLDGYSSSPKALRYAQKAGALPKNLELRPGTVHVRVRRSLDERSRNAAETVTAGLPVIRPGPWNLPARGSMSVSAIQREARIPPGHIGVFEDLCWRTSSGHPQSTHWPLIELSINSEPGLSCAECVRLVV